MADGMVGPARLSKEEVNYRIHQQCNTCVHFYPLNSCEIVAGNISPEMVCDKWTMRVKEGAKDGDFYKGEYEKQQATIKVTVS